MVYILDQVKALEEELLVRIKQQGLSVKPQILVVSHQFIHWCLKVLLIKDFSWLSRGLIKIIWLICTYISMHQVTRLIPDAQGTKCNQEMEPILNTTHSHILRVPFRTDKGILPQWVSRFDIYPYLERFTQASACMHTNFKWWDRIVIWALLKHWLQKLVNERCVEHELQLYLKRVFHILEIYMSSLIWWTGCYCKDSWGYGM